MKASKLEPSATEAYGSSHAHRSYGRWRAATLIGVYVLMTVHVLHWKITGKTLAPLELNEVMYTLELGIVTAGFLFMALAVLASAIFGRFFCSWGCHILALQDLCAWILGKLRIKPRGIRSRLLAWLPLFAAFYMFAWPQVVRVWAGQPLPTLRTTVDADGWASFTTEDFWRNLPGPTVTVATFFVCGFVMVYVLGSRAFCTYACPYGAVFGLVDRLAPGRIRVGADCAQCGACTSVCSSHVRVHEELARYGTVVDPACMKDLDCVSVCPPQSLHYGFGRPSLFQPAVGETVVRRRYDFARWEEVVLMAVGVVLLVIYRGLYDTLPFLLSLALAGIGAYLFVVLARLAYRQSVHLNRWPLKSDGRLMGRGKLFALAMAGIVLLTIHSGVVHYHSFEGRRHFALAYAGRVDRKPAVARAIHLLNFAARWGLVRTERDVSILADLYLDRENWSLAQEQLQWLLSRDAANPEAHIRMGRVLAKQEENAKAHGHYRTAIELDPDRAHSHYALAGFYFDTGQPSPATHHLREAVRLRPDFAEAHYDLGAILIETRQLPSGIDHLRRAVELKPDFGDAHYNLAVALSIQGRGDEAVACVERALGIQPNDERTRALHEVLHDKGRPSMPNTNGAPHRKQTRIGS